MVQDIFDKIAGFIKAVFAELKFIEFPTRQQTLKLGNTVLLISAIFATSLYLLDWLFLFLRHLLTSIKI